MEFFRQLKEAAYKHSTVTGKKYTLTSGQVSDEYVDVKLAILKPYMGDMLAQHVSNAMGCLVGVVAGVELGGALLAVKVAAYRQRPCLVVRKDDRSHGATMYGVDGLDNLPVSRYGEVNLSTTWLVEDVITTGGSTIKALDRLALFAQLRVVGVVAVVDREQDGVAAIKEKHPNVEVKTLITLSALRNA